MGLHIVERLVHSYADSARSAQSPMELMGLADSLGTVEPGKKADLVLLDANPLADISNTRRVVGVWRAGHFYDRGELDSMLAAVAEEQRRR